MVMVESTGMRIASLTRYRTIRTTKLESRELRHVAHERSDLLVSVNRDTGVDPWLGVWGVVANGSKEPDKQDETVIRGLIAWVCQKHDSLSSPEELIANPPHRFQARQYDPAHQAISDHPPFRLVRPDLVPLVGADELMEPHGPVHRDQ